VERDKFPVALTMGVGGDSGANPAGLGLTEGSLRDVSLDLFSALHEIITE
jgi:hypothetical protein